MRRTLILIQEIFKPFLTGTAEQQLCVVQVVERVGLVASSFQFYIRFGACKKT
jgi:hypothetical protein